LGVDVAKKPDVFGLFGAGAMGGEDCPHLNRSVLDGDACIVLRADVCSNVRQPCAEKTHIREGRLGLERAGE
jgi:hypothetical protein